MAWGPVPLSARLEMARADWRCTLASGESSITTSGTRPLALQMALVAEGSVERLVMATAARRCTSGFVEPATCTARRES